jgi:predicted CxxxxCH...CXXCH cytochrome family protein
MNSQVLSKLTRRPTRAAALVAALVAAAPAAAQTTIGDGVNPGPASVCPGSAARQYVNAFTVTAPTATSVREVRLVFSPAGASQVIGLVEVLGDDGTTVYGSVVPTSDMPTVRLTTNLPVPASPATAQYRIYVTPKSHAAMPPASAGGLVPVSATVALVVTGGQVTGRDTASGTVSIDNLADREVAFGAWSATTAPLRVTGAWAGPRDALVVKRANGPVVVTAANGPVDGQTYTAGAVIGNGAVVASTATGFTDSAVVSGTSYYYMVFTRDACGNWSSGIAAGPITPGGPSEGSVTSGTRVPVVGLLNPLGGVVTSPFKIQARVFSPQSAGGTDQPLTVVARWTSGGAVSSQTLTYNANYGGTAGTNGVWETPAAGLSIVPGSYTFWVEAQNASSAPLFIASSRVGIVVTDRKGDGNLLVRDNSSQLCADCHAMKPHSSAELGSRWGSWWVGCRQCHQPHGTPNVSLVAKTVTPPAVAGASVPREVAFSKTTGYSAVGGLQNPAEASFANQDGSGICQVCHTRTAYFRNDGTGTDHNAGSDCASCHAHKDGLAASCAGCHGTPGRVVAGGDALVSSAPPKAYSGATLETDMAVGEHLAHVTQSNLSAAPLACSECHPVPNSHATVPGSEPANVVMGGKGAFGTVPVWNPATGSCASYCHGATLAGTRADPLWAASQGVTCTSCHGAPPAQADGHPSNPNCAGCHGAGYSTTTVAKATHIDTNVDVTRTGCTTCHGDPTATVIAATGVVAPGFNANAVDSAGNPSTATNVRTVGAHAAHLSPVMSAAFTCDECHVVPGTGDVGHANGALGMGFGPIATDNGRVTAAYAQAGATCTTYCHSRANPVGGTDVLAAPAFTNPANLTCTACHAGGGPGSTLSPAHVAHTDADYAYGCVRCHETTTTTGSSIVAGGGAHVNRVKDVDFDAAGMNNGGGTYTAASRTCNNTYCHSSGADRTAPYTSGPSIAWNAGATTCTSCHGGAAGAGQIATNAHPEHVNVAGSIGGAAASNYECGSCHAQTVAINTNTPITTASNHVNLNPNVSFDAFYGGTFTAAAEGAGTCASTYCHSSGQATPAFVAPPAWNSTTNLGCNGCHGTGNAAGAPAYASGAAGSATANSHMVHTANGTDATTCEHCHATVANAAGTGILASSALHVDKGRDVAILGTFDTNGGTSNYTAATKTCNNVSCHGAGTPQWGGTALGCRDCHSGTGAGDQDVDQFVYNDGTISRIDLEDWTAYGHGTTAAFAQSGNPAANLDRNGATVIDGCRYCHTTAVSHGTATNPFRLTNVGAGNTPADKVGVCTICHGGAGFDPDGAGALPLKDATRNVNATHYGAAHAVAGGGTGGELCWDCHDPHGDFNYGATQAIAYMIDENPVRTHASATGTTSWGDYATATRAPTADFRALRDGTAGFGWGDYVVNTTYDGVCQVCHTSANVGHFRGTAAGTQFYDAAHNPGARCTTCHSHGQPPAAAFAPAGGACNACHNAPPNVGAHFAHDQVRTLPTSYGSTASIATAASYGYGCGNCHGTTATNHINDATSPYTTDIVFPAGGTYTPGVAVNDTGPGGLVFTYSNGTCASTYCHDPQGAAYAPANPTWTQAGPLACSACHDDDVGTTTLSGKHDRHILSTGYNIGCQRCHSGTTSNGTTITSKLLHGDGAPADVAFDALNPAATQAGTGATKTCSNMYCHSNGNPLGGTLTYAAAINWTSGTVNAECSSCHGGNSAAVAKLVTGKHAQHTDAVAVLGANYTCQECHGTVATGDRTLLAAGLALHADGTKNVSMADRGPAGGDTYASPTCSNVYCHSSGQATPTFRSVTWNQVGVIGCNGCHGTGNATGSPDYANGGAGQPTANSHSAHTSAGADATTCVACHSGFVTAAGTGIPAGTTHTNNTRNVAFSAGGTYTAGTKTCSGTGTGCHSAGTPQWGATILCSDCHLGTGDAPNYNINDNVASRIDTTQWSGLGHGQTTAAYAEFTQAGITNKCAYCHDTNVGHTVAANPFRLRGASAVGGATGAYSNAAASVNAVCLNCHGTVANGVDPDGAGGQPAITTGAIVRVNAYHSGARHTAALNGGQRCWDCHDVHGDGTNIKMVASNVISGGSDADGLVATRPAQAVSFTANGTGSNYVATIAPFGAGVCNACHTAPTAHYTQTAGDGHFTSQRCVACHAHNQGTNLAFTQTAATACGSCHNAPPTAGSHAKHLEAGAAAVPTSYAGAVTPTATQYAFACVRCHNGTHLNNNANPLVAEVIFQSGGGTYTAGGTVGSETNATSGLSFRNTNGTGCNANYCHNPQGGAVYAARLNPAWGSGVIGCAACHDDDVGTTTLSTWHDRHILSTGYNIGCNQCHQATTTNGTSIADKRNHVNGTRNVAFDTAVNPGATVTGTSPAITCNNLYCHSSGQATPVYRNIAWNATANATCTACHGGNATSGTILATGKHTNHVNNTAVIGTNYGCADCHNTVVSADRTVSTLGNHVNQARNVGIADRGPAGSDSYTAPNCTVYCHSSGQATPTYRAISWTQVGTLGCNGCHGTGNATGAPDYASGAAGSATANSHARHTGNGATATTCVDCHSGFVNAAGTAITGSSHTNGTRNVAFAAGGTYTAGTKTCSGTGTGCHSAGTPQWGGAALACDSCHGGAADAPNYAFDNVAAIINTGTEWTTYGHGSSSATAPDFTEFSGVTTSNRCLYCHDGNVAHELGTNPFRLRGAADTAGATGAYNALSAKNGNEVCLNCHDTSNTVAYGVDPDGAGTLPRVGQGAGANPLERRIDAWHYGADHLATQDGGRRCWDCHDPHGDLTNLTMIASRPLRDAADDHGFAGTRVGLDTVMTTRATAASYVNTTTRNGVCQVCHTTTAYWRATTEPTAHEVGNNCMGCHAHQKPPNLAFEGAGECITCHNGAVSSPIAQALNSTVTTRRAIVPEFSQAWSHKRSDATGNKVDNIDCGVCHMEGSAATGVPTAFHKDGVINLRDPDTGDHIKSVTYTAASGTNPGGFTTPATPVNVTFVRFSRNLSLTLDGETAAVRDAIQATMVNQCLKCHDGDGAASSLARVSTGGTAGKPFGTTISHTTSYTATAGFTACAEAPAWSSTTRYDLGSWVKSGATYYRSIIANNTNQAVTVTTAWQAAQAWSAATTYGQGHWVTVSGVPYRSAQPGNLNRAPATSPTWWQPVNATDGCVNNVAGSLSTANSSYHPVLGQQNNWYSKLTRMAAPWNAATTGRGTSADATSWGWRLSCWDCHAPNGTASTVTLTATVTAHGGATTVRGNATASGTSPTSTTGATLCWRCHAGYNAATDTHGSGSALSGGTDGGMQPFLQYGCNRCHASDYSTAVARPVRGVDVHGVDTLPLSPASNKTGRWASTSTGTPAQVNARPYAFIRNTRSLSTHQPARIGGSTYSATCVHLGDSPCSNRTETYSPGGTF